MIKLTQIRLYQPEDKEQLIILWLKQQVYHYQLDPEYYPQPSPVMREQISFQIKKFLEDEKSKIVVAEDGGVLLGFAVFIITEDSSIDSKGIFCYLDELFVDETDRGKGIGQRIFSYIENFLEKKGVFCIKVNSAIQNKIAFNFYKKAGFKEKSFSMIKFLK